MGGFPIRVLREATLLVVICLIALLGACHPTPEVAFPGLSIDGRAGGLSLDESDGLSLGGAPFSVATHKWLTQELECSSALNAAHYRMDFLLVTVAAVHFDNCDFDGGIQHIQREIAQAKVSADAGDTEMALAHLGRALHTLQDFYAHSNYVELMELEHPDDKKAVRPLLLWTPDGQKKLVDLRKGGRLVSGVTFWGSLAVAAGAGCPAGTGSHDEIAKDSLKDVNGKASSPPGWGGTRYRAARDLAQAESIAFLRATVGSWPQLVDACGGAIAFATLLDGRNHASGGTQP